VDERRFPRSNQSLDAIFEFIATFLRANGVEERHAFDLDLIAEELFTNMVKYGGGRGDIALGLAREPDAVLLVLRDFDADPYDVTRPRALPEDGPVRARRAGGLGLHLVQRMADGLDYRHEGRVSTVTVRKRIES
jgi:serine/threonine-protein kinase RsbW